MSEQTIPQLRTRKPTGKPPWPMILLAGVEKSGKSYSAAAFSASDLVDRTFWIEIGEGAADQYGALPGARYEIVEHDGSYRGIGNAIWAATQQPRENGKPHAIVIDSMTELWDLLSDEAQAEANARYRRKNPNKAQDAEAQITMDLWNVAKKRWRAVVDMLRVYDGPVILTSRLEQVAVIENGKPTEAKTLKVRAEKNLPYEVDAIVQIPGPRQYQLTGVRSVRWTMKPGGFMELPDFTVDRLLRDLGLNEVDAVSARSYTAPKPQPPQEVTVNQAVGQMRRRQVSEPPPEDDPWESEPPEQQPKPSTHGQRTKLVMLVKDKRGQLSDDDRRAAVGAIIGRELGSFTHLTFDEAGKAIEALTAEPDYAGPASVPEPPKPNPRNGDGGKPLDPALFVPDLQALVISSQTEGGLGVYDHLRKLIGEATTTSVLKALWRVANEARKTDEISTQDFDRLNALSQERNAQLSGQAPAGQPSDAPNSEQYDARDHFRHEIKRAGTPEDLGAIWNKVLEARDAGQLTQIQVDGLNREIEARYQAMPGAKPPEQSGEGWSHAHPVAQRLDEAVSAGGGR